MPQYQMLFFHPAFYLSSDILPRNPQERLRYNKLLNRTTPCELFGNFISSHSSKSRDPVQPHRMLGIILGRGTAKLMTLCGVAVVTERFGNAALDKIVNYLVKPKFSLPHLLYSGICAVL